MAKFMLLLGGVERPAGPTGDYDTVAKRYGTYVKDLMERGHFLATNALFPGQGVTLRVTDDRIVDGPFAESKEAINGYFLIEARDLAEATRIAKGCPILLEQRGFCQVRPVSL